MAFDIQFKLIYQGIRDVFRVRSLRNKQIGFNEGIDALSELIQILLKEKKLDEVDRVTKNKKYRIKMLKAYNLLYGKKSKV